MADRYFVFAYGNAQDEPQIITCDNKDQIYETVSNFNNAGMLTDTYSENDLWEMYRKASQYDIIRGMHFDQPRYEYKTVEVDDCGKYIKSYGKGQLWSSATGGPSNDYEPPTWGNISELGLDGWELIAITNQNDQLSGFFKRGI